jgi:hypothetical protein
MEINGRFWGSLPLTVASGLDYPWWLYLRHVLPDTALPFPEPVVGLRQRYLKQDVAWAARSLFRSGNPMTLIEWLLDFRHGGGWDVERWDDPLPAVLDWLDPFRSGFARIARKIGFPPR